MTNQAFPAIVVCAYNRPYALQRLLRSLQAAYYPPGKPVPLHISIDHAETPAVWAVQEVAEGFDWPYGPKQVDLQARRGIDTGEGGPDVVHDARRLRPGAEKPHECQIIA